METVNPVKAFNASKDKLAKLYKDAGFHEAAANVEEIIYIRRQHPDGFRRDVGVVMAELTVDVASYLADPDGFTRECREVE